MRNQIAKKKFRDNIYDISGTTKIIDTTNKTGRFANLDAVGTYISLLGDIILSGSIKTSSSSSRLEITNTGIKAYNTGTQRMGLNSDGSGWLGGSVSNPSISWNSAGSTTVKATIESTSGTIGGWAISSSTLQSSSGNIILDSAGKISIGSGNSIAILDSNDTTYRLWVGNSVPSSAPFRVGLDGALTATNANITGTITSTSGQIGGWIISTDLLKSQSSGARIELNKSKNRISIFDGIGEKVVVGYLGDIVRNNANGTATGGGTNYLDDSTKDWQTNELAGLTLVITGGTGAGQSFTISGNTQTRITISGTFSTIPDSTSTYEVRYPSNIYGFWAKYGDSISIDGDVFYESGDWIIQNNGSIRIYDSQNSEIIRLGTDTGNKGLFIYDTSGNNLAKFHSGGVEIIAGTPGGNRVSLDTTYGLRAFSGTTQRVSIAPDGSGWLGSQSKFKWDSSGNVYIYDISATTGTVGGWTIGSSTLTGGNAILDSSGKLTLGNTSDAVVIDSQHATYRFWVGNTNPSLANLTIDKSGYITATGVNLEGTFTVDNLVIKGTATVTGLKAEHITSGVLDSQRLRVGKFTTAIDPNTDVLFHFDDGTYSTQGHQFADTTAATIIPEEGYFGGAVAVEEPTENKIETEGGGASQDWSLWSHYNNSSYWTAVEQYMDPIMGMVFKGVAADSTYIYDYYPYTITSGKKYTFSVYIKADTTISRNFRFYIRNSNYSVNTSVYKTYLITTEWQRIEFTITAPSTASAIGIGMKFDDSNGNAGITYYIAKPQFEEKDHATSFVKGIRTSNKMYIKPSDMGIDFNNGNQWTVAMRIKPNAYLIQNNLGSPYSRLPVFEIGEYYQLSETSITVLAETFTATNALRVAIYDNKTALIKPDAHTFTSADTNDWILLALRYDGTTLFFDTYSVSSGHIQTSATVSWSYPIRDNFYLGCYGWTGNTNWEYNYWGGLIDELLIVPRFVDDKELDAWYNFDSPFFDASPNIVKANGRIVIDKGGLRAYDSDGLETINLGSESGSAVFRGNMTVGQDNGQRIIIDPTKMVQRTANGGQFLFVNGLLTGEIFGTTTSTGTVDINGTTCNVTYSNPDGSGWYTHASIDLSPLKLGLLNPRCILIPNSVRNYAGTTIDELVFSGYIVGTGDSKTLEIDYYLGDSNQTITWELANAADKDFGTSLTISEGDPNPSDLNNYWMQVPGDGREHKIIVDVSGTYYDKFEGGYIESTGYIKVWIWTGVWTEIFSDLVIGGNAYTTIQFTVPSSITPTSSGGKWLFRVSKVSTNGILNVVWRESNGLYRKSITGSVTKYSMLNSTNRKLSFILLSESIVE